MPDVCEVKFPVLRLLCFAACATIKKTEGGSNLRENRMFEEMLRVARSWLEGKSAADVAKKAQARLQENGLGLDCFGVALYVDWSTLSITPEQDPWVQLAVLHYLNLADGFPLTGEWMSFAQYRDGMIRGGDFDRRVELSVREKLSKLPTEALRARALALGGKETVSNADLCVEIPALPRFPLLLKIWFADEEFEASGRLLVDKSAAHYLTVEDAVMLGELILGKLCI